MADDDGFEAGDLGLELVVLGVGLHQFIGGGQDPADLLEINDALRELGESAPRAAKVVELRFFSGLSNVESAALLGVTERTVERDWRYAKAWLFRKLHQGSGEATSRAE